MKIAGMKYVSQSNKNGFAEEVENLLLYRKIVKAEKVDNQEAVLTLDNGTELLLKGNEGCGGCGYGWFYIDELNGCENVITKVECVQEDGNYGDECVYHIFVYAEDKKNKRCSV